MAREVRVIVDVAAVQALLIRCPKDDCGEETRVPLVRGASGQALIVPVRCHYCNQDWGRNPLGRDYVESFRSQLCELAHPSAGTLSARLEVSGELIDGKQ